MRPYVKSVKAYGRTTDEAADMALMTWARLVEARRIGIERDKA